MRFLGMFAGAAALVMASAAAAQPVPVRMGPQQSPIATSVRAPAGSNIIWVSGTVPDVVNPDAPAGSVERFGDTAAQTRSILGKIETALAQHGMGLADVVMMRVFLVAPPGQSAMDFGGMMKAYSERFGTAAQPNKPARSTMEVAGLVDPGWLAEIEVTAAGGRKQPK
jgi:enamine deaminase RidA (YjgF/YER057c/UK114 family)